MSAASPPLVNVVDLSVIDSLNQWALQRGMRGRDISDTIARAMRYWVSFAMAKVPRGDPAKIRAQLMQVVEAHGQARDARGRFASVMRGTLAARLVFLLNYKGARQLARVKSPQFDKVAQQYANARAYSANHHRSGFLPAVNALGRAGGAGTAPAGRMPKYRQPPGAMSHKFNDQVATILVENFASASANQPFSRPAGIAGLAGTAFDQGLLEVRKMVENFLARDQTRAARAVGFQVAT